jgi:hypothetical protein
MKGKDMTFSRLLLSALLALLPAVALCAEPEMPGTREIVLSTAAQPDADRNDAFTAAEILPVPGNGTVFALRANSTEEALYSFSLLAVNLVDLLGTLSQTLYDANDTAAIFSHGERLTVWDASASDRTIDITVDELTLEAALDLVSVASGCNIFITNRTIVVDRCE